MNAIEREVQAVQHDVDVWRKKLLRLRNPTDEQRAYLARLEARIRELERHLREEESA